MYAGESDRLRLDLEPHRVRLHLAQSATPESRNRLRRGEVEVAFLLRPVADPRLAVETVLRYRHVAAFPSTKGRRRAPAGGRRLALREGRSAPASRADAAPIDPAELARGALVLLARGTQTRHLVDEAFRSRGIEPERVLEVGSVSIQKEMVRCGLGVGVLPDYAVEPADRLRARPIAGASVREIAVAWRRDLPLTRAAEVFLELTRAEAARRAPAPLSSSSPGR